MEDILYYFLSFFLSFFIWPCDTACGILVPRAGIKPTAPALEVRSLNHWTAREVPILHVAYWDGAGMGWGVDGHSKANSFYQLHQRGPSKRHRISIQGQENERVQFSSKNENFVFI